MNAKTQAAVMAHGQNLIALFHLPKDTDPVTLCKKLRRLEREATNIGLRLCNGPEYPTEDAADIATERILDRVDKLLGFRALDIPVFVNHDPRGYALKISDEWMRNCRCVARDGQPLYVGTEPEVWLHKRHSYSVDHACKYEGYTIDRPRLHTDWGGYGIIAPDLTE